MLKETLKLFIDSFVILQFHVNSRVNIIQYCGKKYEMTHSPLRVIIFREFPWQLSEQNVTLWL